MAGANRLRRDGLRWIPRVNGNFDIPVVSLHTLGDLYVPFKMQQIFRQRANANGSGRWLVQRAIRAPSHCDFTVAEQVAAFDDMVRWEQTGKKPAGDDVLTPAHRGRQQLRLPLHQQHRRRGRRRGDGGHAGVHAGLQRAVRPGAR